MSDSSNKVMQALQQLAAVTRRSWASWNGALMFYTCLPLPRHWPVEFRWIAGWVVGVGAVVGSLLALVDLGLGALQVPLLVGSALVVTSGIALTGGLHLDGAIDAADGLAVTDRARRLTVMTDSRMGAFGGMAAIALILLKVLALSSLETDRCFCLVAAAVWGRWGQQWAIARYPYLKKEGKGAFHKAALPSIGHTLPSFIGICGLSVSLGVAGLVPWVLVWRTAIGGTVLAMSIGAYFYRQLGGHTGDTYGAVVEWTEALLLCSLTAGT